MAGHGDTRPASMKQAYIAPHGFQYLPPALQPGCQDPPETREIPGAHEREDILNVLPKTRLDTRERQAGLRRSGGRERRRVLGVILDQLVLVQNYRKISPNQASLKMLRELWRQWDILVVQVSDRFWRPSPKPWEPLPISPERYVDLATEARVAGGLDASR